MRNSQCVMRNDYDEFIKVYPFTADDLEGEIWKIIPHYEDYQASNFGRVKSFKNGKTKSFRVNRLVATLFIPNPEDKPEVNHMFGNKFDNYFENLERATHNENMRHAFDTGLQIQGIDCSYSKIKSEEEIIYIRNNPDKLSRKELAKKFGVSQPQISYIQLGKTHKNIGGKIRESKSPRRA